MLRAIIKIILKILFRVEVRGIENFHAAGDRVLVIANHASLIDALIIKLFLPRGMYYAIDERDASHWWARPFVKILDYCVIDTQSPLSVKTLIDFMGNDNKILLFPEARISDTNSLMKVHPSTGMVADKADATLLPVYIDGTQYSYFNNLGGVIKRRLLPKVIVTILPPRKMELASTLKGQVRRQAAVEYLTALMREMRLQATDCDMSLYQALLNARKRFGGRRKIIEDFKRQSLSYNQIIMRTILLGRILRSETKADEPVGVFLPTSITTTVMIFSLHLHGRYPAMLNYGVGKKPLLSCIKSADVKCVYTSRAFISEAGLDELLEALQEVVEVRYLEDVAKKIGLLQKLSGLIKSCFADRYYAKQKKVAADDAAVVLFTSGSEGLPKGVVLSHKNLMINITQVACIVDFSIKDKMLNFLPMFHSFGITAGTLLPLILGIRVFQYPSPLHYKVIPGLAYEINATVIFATNTFLSGYAQQAHGYDFRSIRYVFAGAEPLTEYTEKLWMKKFGLRIFQGYGATETSPVLSANTPLTYRSGTAGHFVPGIEYKLVEVPGIEVGKRLQVKGQNIMKGYLMADQPGVIVPPSTDEAGEGWYDTGDIVDVDEQGYLTICGRAKRFAKIAGEMISLAVVEQIAEHVWPDALHAAVAIPDRSKGEQIILVTDCVDAVRKPMLAYAKKEGISELHVAKTIEIVRQLPILASGKLDYVRLKEIIEEGCE